MIPQIIEKMNCFKPNLNDMIGRDKEKKILNKAYKSNKPELVALIGRRRVGKTYLVRQFFQDKIDFEVVGLQEENKEKQLRNFAYSIRDAKGELEKTNFCCHYHYSWFTDE